MAGSCSGTGTSRTGADPHADQPLHSRCCSAAVGLEIAALLLGGFGATADDSQFNPLLTSAGLAAWIALGMAGTTLLIAVLIRAALKGQRSSAVQAATGFFYLAVITAMTAEFAAKVRFLP
jgi:hypothetical protein